MKRTSRIALGGIFSAVAVLVLLLTIFPFATYALPPLAGAFLIPLVIECGKKWALCAYAAVSLVALLIVPDVEAKTLFIVFFGYYPIVKAALESIKSRIWEWLLKLLIFNAATIGGYTVLSQLGFSLDSFRIEGVAFPLYGFLLLFLLAGNVIFVIYDIGLTRFLPLYFSRFQPIIHRLFQH
ncbi:MAG: hypothetical protein IJO75_01015 [Clostridia bacterium]|nr:hypothetical protein [Clostridia bacterium]